MPLARAGRRRPTVTAFGLAAGLGLAACQPQPAGHAPPASATDLVPICLSDSRCGFVHPDGREAIPFRFGLVEEFDAVCGLALAFDRTREAFGFIDPSGSWRIAPRYPDARSFDSHGLALVRETDGRWRLLRCDGRAVAAFDATAGRALARPMATRERFSSGAGKTP